MILAMLDVILLDALPFEYVEFGIEKPATLIQVKVVIYSVSFGVNLCIVHTPFLAYTLPLLVFPACAPLLSQFQIF